MSPIVSGGARGGSPVGRATYRADFAGTTCQPSVFTPLSWTGADPLHIGDNLVNLTDPTNPTVVSSGWYIVTAQVLMIDDMNDDKVFLGQLTMGDLADNIYATDGKASTPNFTEPSVVITLPWYLTAGKKITVLAVHTDSVARNCYPQVWIVQLA